MTDAERMAAMRTRNSQAGKAQVNITLPEAVIRKLDRLAKRDELTRAELIEQLIKNAK